jgi:hypothetical protein
MNPSLDVRLSAMIKVLETIVIPALETGMARDQAMLVVGHLRVIRGQADFAQRYEELELCALRKLARGLLTILEGGAATRLAGAAVEAAIAVSHSSDPVLTRQRLSTTNAALEELVRAAARDGSADFVAETRGRVLQHARTQSLRDRRWFGGMGFDGEAAQPLGVLIAEFAAECGEANAVPVSRSSAQSH